MSALARSLRTALLALAGAALLVPAPAAAQRRALTGKPATSEAPAEEKKDPKGEAKPEEKKADAEDPAKKPAPAAAQPAPPAKEEPKREPLAQPKKDLPPAPPTILVPKDEQGAPKAEGKPAVTAAKADEVLYRKKIDKTIVTLRVRPAKPVPGKSTTLMFEIVKLLAVPDPSLGDRVPLEKATLFATIGRDGAQATRYRLHPLVDAGIYGVHFTAPISGAYRIQLDQRLENAEIGDKPVSTEFVLGIGQDTAMQAAEEEAAVKTGRGRTALRVGDGAHGGAAQVMRALGDGWLALLHGLSNQNTGVDLVGLARGLGEGSAKLAGQVPEALSSQRREFDALAGELATALKDLLPAVGTDATKARALMAKIETDQCARCHVKYRFQITDDVAAWPKFTPKAPKDASSASKKPARQP